MHMANHQYAMFGLSLDEERLWHQRIACAILIQTLFIFPLLYFVIPGKLTACRW
jgi:hypothetical protein